LDGPRYPGGLAWAGPIETVHPTPVSSNFLFHPTFLFIQFSCVMTLILCGRAGDASGAHGTGRGAAKQPGNTLIRRAKALVKSSPTRSTSSDRAKYVRHRWRLKKALDIVGECLCKHGECAVICVNRLVNLLLSMGEADQVGAVVEHSSLEHLLLQQRLCRQPLALRIRLAHIHHRPGRRAGAKHPLLYPMADDRRADALL